jgi:hypothetical protein
MRSNLLVGIAIGAGAALFGPKLWQTNRQTIKKTLRAGIEGYGAARVAAARFGEEVEDLVAEVLYEMKEGAEGEAVVDVGEKADG